MIRRGPGRPPAELPSGYYMRRPTRGDLEAVAALMNACDLADLGAPDTPVEDLESDWALPRFRLDRDAWLLVDDKGAMVAYGWSWDREPATRVFGDTYVHPEHRTAPLESFLLDRIEERAREHVGEADPRTEVTLGLFEKSGETPRAGLLRSRGFRPIRTFYRMKIELERPVPEPRWPEGVAPHAFRVGRDERALEETIQEAFSGHFRFARESHAEWVKRRIEHRGFDPTLCVLAWRGKEPVAGVLNYAFDDGGWIRELGVRTAWRGRGVGKALLLESFRRLAARGMRSVALGVDAANETGATALYERVGMRVVQRHDLYEKTLRPARDVKPAARPTE